MNFDEAFVKLVGIEGGYVNDPADRGGETKFGLSARSYPGENIAGMTLERAKLLYQRDFWGPAGCDSVPDPVKYALFDTAVNTSAPGSCKTAICMLQRAVGEQDDGVLGPHTLQALQSMDPMRLLCRFLGFRGLYNVDCPTWGVHGKGWTRRVARLQTEA